MECDVRFSGYYMYVQCIIYFQIAIIGEAKESYNVVYLALQ